MQSTENVPNSLQESNSAFTQTFTSQSLTLENKQSPQLKSLNTKDLRCTYRNQGISYCTDCKQFPIVCGQLQCQCHNIHKDCVNSKFIKQYNKLLSSKILWTKLSQKLQPIYGKMIDQISSLREKIQDQLQYFGLTKQQKDTFQGIQNLEEFYLDQQVSFPQIDRSEQIFYQDALKAYGVYLNSSKSKIIKHFQEISKQICLQFTLKNQKKFNPFNQSNIIKTIEEKTNMFSMLYQQKNSVNKIERLFVATQDGFDSYNFQKKCMDKENLLYVVQNQFDCKYGGFQVPKLSTKTRGQFVGDSSKQSFIYSLNKNIKSKIIEQQFAVCNGNGTQSLISFGQHKGCSFVIGQGSDKESKSNWINCAGTSYEKLKKINNTMINGKEFQEGTIKCKLKQVQVFQVSFKKKVQQKS